MKNIIEEILEEFEKKFLQMSYCGNMECEYSGDDKCFHGTENEFKDFLRSSLQKAINAERRNSKITIIEEKEKLLNEYSRCLEKKGYLDSSWWSEEPKAVE